MSRSPDVIEYHLPKPGTICFAISIEGTSVGLMTSEVLGNVGIGGLVITAPITLLGKVIPVVVVLDGCRLCFPLSIKA